MIMYKGYEREYGRTRYAKTIRDKEHREFPFSAKLECTWGDFFSFNMDIGYEIRLLPRLRTNFQYFL